MNKKNINVYIISHKHKSASRFFLTTKDENSLICRARISQKNEPVLSKIDGEFNVSFFFSSQ